MTFVSAQTTSQPAARSGSSGTVGGFPPDAAGVTVPVSADGGAWR
mgnify:CR=1 FL=1